MTRRVVITGMALVSPLGSSPEKLWDGLTQGASGVVELAQGVNSPLPIKHGSEARQFTAAIEDFGPLEKTKARTIKKALKVMCRDMQMGVAVAQVALHDSGVQLEKVDRDRFGVLFGADYMCTLPEEFSAAFRACFDEQGKFHFDRWGTLGLSEIEPLWLLKYLPNLPASHVAIFNELHGPNNSLTMGEAAANLAIIEGFQTVVRGHADRMLVGATGTRIHPIRYIQQALHEELASGGDNPAELCRPFDLHRRGGVVGEGAAALLLEELESALSRGAKIYGEVLGGSSSTVTDKTFKPRIDRAVENVLSRTLAAANLKLEEVGHIHAHGFGSQKSDASEAQAIKRVFGSRAVPVVTAKANFGNLGASSGVVETIASLQALQHGHLFRTLNYKTPDPACPIAVTQSNDVPAGDSFVNLNVTSVGQAACIAVRKLTAA